MTDATTILSLGAILLIGLATDALGRRTPLPRVTLLLVFGVAIGPEGLDLLPETVLAWFDLTADMALLMVGFLLGGQFTARMLRTSGRAILCVSIAAVVVTTGIVLAGLLATGVSLEVALLLAGIAPATAPAAIADVVRETKANGPFSRTLLGVVALDDAWGLIVFTVCLSLVSVLVGLNGHNSAVWLVVRDIGGAVVLGLLIGLPAAYLTGRMEPGEPMLAEALGIVFVCGGIAMYFDVSFLIAAMVLGATIANLAKHHTRPFHAIEGIEWPFMILFFLLAGASLQIEALESLQMVGAVYVVARIVGRMVGGWAGSRLGKTDEHTRRWIGLAMMPQAGVALGMALVASSRIPQFRETLLPVIIGSTVLFEVSGPVLTRWALIRAGESSI